MIEASCLSCFCKRGEWAGSSIRGGSPQNLEGPWVHMVSLHFGGHACKSQMLLDGSGLREKRDPTSSSSPRLRRVWVLTNRFRGDVPSHMSKQTVEGTQVPLAAQGSLIQRTASVTDRPWSVHAPNCGGHRADYMTASCAPGTL